MNSPAKTKASPIMQKSFSVNVIRAVLFDFDGTLADSYDAIAASVNHVRAKYGLPAIATAEVKQHVGRGLPYLLERTAPTGDPEADQHIYRAHHPTVMKPKTRTLPGAVESLVAIKGSGRATGLCSNKPSRFSKQLLEHLDVHRLVDVVYGPEDVDAAKPSPDMLVSAMRQLDVEPEQTLYIGDMIVDIETARAANVTVWVVPTGSETLNDLRNAKPDRILDDLHELAAMFDGAL